MKPKVYRFDVSKSYWESARYRLFVLKTDYDRLMEEHLALTNHYKRLCERHASMTTTMVNDKKGIQPLLAGRRTKFYGGFSG